VLGDGEGVVIDTRISPRQAAEILDDVRSLTSSRITTVINTHAHSDHCFGNRTFRPCTIWGHERAATFLAETGERQRADLAIEEPAVADELAAVVFDAPDRTFRDRATIEVGGRALELTFLGRGHTDHDIVVAVPDAEVLFAGDLLENGAPPYFGSGYPLDWPATVDRLLALVGDATVVVPGHGDVAGRAFAEASRTSFQAIADLARRLHAEAGPIDDLLADAPWGGGPLVREALERALLQLRGELL
jgi:glyoxylase-like metal-dependent hydrolase (beta-lactamase superfamily II)